jgi:hypothetical protein
MQRAEQTNSDGKQIRSASKQTRSKQIISG